MMRKYQQGVATLLITSILLSVALVVTLGSYKICFTKLSGHRMRLKRGKSIGWQRGDWSVFTLNLFWMVRFLPHL